MEEIRTEMYMITLAMNLTISTVWCTKTIFPVRTCDRWHHSRLS